MALLSHYLGNGPVFNHPGTDTLDIQDLRQPVHTIQRAHEFKRMGDYTNTPELTCSQNRSRQHKENVSYQGRFADPYTSSCTSSTYQPHKSHQ